VTTRKLDTARPERLDCHTPRLESATMPNSPRLNSRVPQPIIDQIDEVAARHGFSWAGEGNRSRAVQLLLDWALKTIPAGYTVGDQIEVSYLVGGEASGQQLMIVRTPAAA
jgi:hypothetical protein